jgi:hypothetical protein
MMRPQPLIAVADVEAGSRWFQQVLGLTSGHGGRNYEMLLVERVRAHEVTVLDGPLLNPNSRNREVWMRGPEGYVVVVSGPGEPS